MHGISKTAFLAAWPMTARRQGIPGAPPCPASLTLEKIFVPRARHGPGRPVAPDLAVLKRGSREAPMPLPDQIPLFFLRGRPFWTRAWTAWSTSCPFEAEAAWTRGTWTAWAWMRTTDLAGVAGL